MTVKQPVALTCGEPAGIGLEIAVKAWHQIGSEVPFFLICDRAHLPADVPIFSIKQPSDCQANQQHALPVLHHDFAATPTLGTPRPDTAQDVIDVIAKGVDLVASGAASALCTGPIHKKILQDGAGFAFPGHTEYLAHLAGVHNVAMMLVSKALRVVPATIHIPLHTVSVALTQPILETCIRLTHAAMIADFGIPDPRIAVAGLNPHAGEGGMMGREEQDVISPVLETLRREGMRLSGPMSADTMFHDAARATYDVAIAMYHDQALIPVKTLAFDQGVNVTLGLPFVRTSPDHGTALDIAGQGVANPSSLIEALRLAQQMAQART